MNVSVYYRGAMGKLHQADVTDVESHAQAIQMVADEAKTDIFAKPPYLALLKGGKQ